MSKTFKVQGQWKGKSAGGCLNHPTWRFNPQLFISVPETKIVKITLQQMPETSSQQQNGSEGTGITNAKNALYHMGFYVAQTDGTIRRQLTLKKDQMVARTQFENAESVSASVELHPDRKYFVLPCTFHPAQEQPFAISFTTEGELSLQPLPPSQEWKYTKVTGEWRGKS